MKLNTCANSLAWVILGALPFGSTGTNTERVLQASTADREGNEETIRVWVRYEKSDHDKVLQSITTMAQTKTNAKMRMVYDFAHSDSVVVSGTEEEI